MTLVDLHLSSLGISALVYVCLGCRCNCRSLQWAGVYTLAPGYIYMLWDMYFIRYHLHNMYTTSYAGASSGLVGKDVMVYSARTGPYYNCLDSSWGNAGTPVLSWTCDENNPNQRSDIHGHVHRSDIHGHVHRAQHHLSLPQHQNISGFTSSSTTTAK
jgi:hypothetical protein